MSNIEDKKDVFLDSDSTNEDVQEAIREIEIILESDSRLRQNFQMIIIGGYQSQIVYLRELAQVFITLNSVNRIANPDDVIETERAIDDVLFQVEPYYDQYVAVSKPTDVEVQQALDALIAKGLIVEKDGGYIFNNSQEDDNTPINVIPVGKGTNYVQ